MIGGAGTPQTKTQLNPETVVARGATQMGMGRQSPKEECIVKKGLLFYPCQYKTS
jgi:hypothetical protein